MMKTMLTALALAVLGGGVAAQGDTLAIRARKVYLGDGVLENALVVVRDGKILAVGPASEVEIPEGATRARAFAVTPGLIDAASANALGGNRTPQESEVVPQYKVADVLDLRSTLMKNLAREGVTSVFVTSSVEAVIGPQGAAVKTGTGPESGRVLDAQGAPRMVMVSGPQFGNQRPSRPENVSDFTRAPLGPMGSVLVARDAWMKAKGVREARAAKLRVSPDPATAMLVDVLDGKRALRVVARDLGEINTAIRLSEEFGFRFTLEEAPEAWRALEALKRTKTPVVYGPVRAANVRQDSPFGFGIQSRAKETRRFDSPRMILDAGLPLALTAAGQTGDYGLVRQAMFAMRYGLTREEAVAAVTATPARLMGVAERVGTIAAGKDADLVLWTGEPFEATSRPERVYIDGKAVEGRVF
ncbi:MAG: amidohydrolase family protein [Planctomycetota bacterium]